MNKQNKDFSACISFSIIGMIIAEMIIFIYMGGETSISAGVIAITVALIGVAGHIFILILQFKKDSNTIGTVKADTSEMKPQIAEINKNGEKVKDVIIEKLVPQMDRIDTTGHKTLTGIEKLVFDLEVRKGIKQQLSNTIIDPDYLLQGVQSIYEQNAALQQAIKERDYQIRDLQQENFRLSRDLMAAQNRLKQWEPDHDMEL